MLHLFGVVLLICYALAAPEQITVVFGEGSTDYVVSWVTFEPFTNQRSHVKFGFSANDLTRAASSASFEFHELRCNTSRIMHNVQFGPVVGNQRVYYQVSSNEQDWSAVFSFVGLDRTGTPQNRPLTVSLTGDVAVAPQTAISSIDQWVRDNAAGRHDMVIHFGDIAYNMDDDCNKVGDNFMRGLSRVATQVPYFIGPGNHETDVLWTYHTYNNRFAGHGYMARASGSDSVRWYSFDVQNVHFVMFDTDAWIYLPVMHLAPPQLAWLRRDLEKVDRRKTPWIVVIGHRAMYCTGTDSDLECTSEAQQIRWGGLFFGGIEPLLLEFGVDLFFAGHSHHYMRTFPVKNATLMQRNYDNPRGPVHVQSGIGGVNGHDPFDQPWKDYDAWRDDTYRVSFSRLVFHNDTHLSFTHHLAATGEVFDSFDLVQTNHGPF